MLIFVHLYNFDLHLSDSKFKAVFKWSPSGLQAVFKVFTNSLNILQALFKSIAVGVIQSEPNIIVLSVLF